jgi:cytochrome c
MINWSILSAILLLGLVSFETRAKDDIREGASMYRACYYCHSLQPGLHLTGPSLANLWGKKAGRVEGFNLYSSAMKQTSKSWDESNLKTWLANPHLAIPGTTMTYEGIKHSDTLEGMIKFLKVAMGPDGFKKVLEVKLLDRETATGQLQNDVSHASSKERIKEIVHCGQIYELTTENGEQTRHWEINIHMMVDSSEKGPPAGKPARIAIGSMGDRFAVVFHEPGEIGKVVKECSKKDRL